MKKLLSAIAMTAAIATAPVQAANVPPALDMPIEQIGVLMGTVSWCGAMPEVNENFTAFDVEKDAEKMATQIFTNKKNAATVLLSPLKFDTIHDNAFDALNEAYEVSDDEEEAEMIEMCNNLISTIAQL